MTSTYITKFLQVSMSITCSNSSKILYGEVHMKFFFLFEETSNRGHYILESWPFTKFKWRVALLSELQTKHFFKPSRQILDRYYASSKLHKGKAKRHLSLVGLLLTTVKGNFSLKNLKKRGDTLIRTLISPSHKSNNSCEEWNCN